MKKRKEDTHKMGKYCGYDVLPNGDIEIAPQYKDEMNTLIRQEVSMDDVLKTIVKAVVEMRDVVSQRKFDWWVKVAEDYGLDMSLNWLYKNGVLIKQNEEENK